MPNMPEWRNREFIWSDLRPCHLSCFTGWTDPPIEEQVLNFIAKAKSYVSQTQNSAKFRVGKKKKVLISAGCKAV